MATGSSTATAQHGPCSGQAQPHGHCSPLGLGPLGLSGCCPHGPCSPSRRRLGSRGASPRAQRLPPRPEGALQTFMNERSRRPGGRLLLASPEVSAAERRFPLRSVGSAPTLSKGWHRASGAGAAPGALEHPEHPTYTPPPRCCRKDHGCRDAPILQRCSHPAETLPSCRDGPEQINTPAS